MRPNEKPAATNSGSILRTDYLPLTMINNTTAQNYFQYCCSFCACELHDDGLRFNGVGACPACNDLAQIWIDSLRQYAANYSNNLGVRK